ncbi:MAG TPA: UTP--glucose-1-phosphate uridylyltransferase, partial [Candidatus Nanopelagicales bacterium]
MSELGLRQAQEKMRAGGVAQPAIDVFSHYYGQLESGATGLIREASIEPLLAAPQLSELEVDAAAARDALDRTVLIKLNGGLGTSMGMDRAKSLLPVREGRSFLDLIAAQVRHARQAYG